VGTSRSPRLRSRCRPVIEILESRRVTAVTFNIYSIGPAVTATSITAGPDGNLWFTLNPSAIGEINPSTGAIAEFPFPSAVAQPLSIVSGPAGNLWFLDGPNIASINPANHIITEYPNTIPGAVPVQLAVGPDGNLWYTDAAHAAIGLFIVSTQSFNEFPLPSQVDVPGPITAGPDGNLWFGVRQEIGIVFEAFGMINTGSHSTRIINLPSGTTGVTAITSGPDGNLWFSTSLATNPASYEIGSIQPTTFAVTLYQGGGAGGITTGPDGNIWFDNPLGEFNLRTLVATTYVQPGTPSPGINGITTGPDGNIWLTANSFIESARIIPASQAAVAGFVYLDATGSGPPSPPGVVNPLGKATVFLDLKGDGRLDPGDPTANTDALGYYAFTGLPPGTYTVRLALYPGNIATYPNNATQTVIVAGGQLGSPSQLGLLPTSSLIPLTFNPSPFGSKNPDVQTAEVIALYHLILGRAPDPTGQAAAVSYLKTGGSVAQVAAGLLHSVEYETAVVASYYRTFLRRTGSSSEIALWVAFMQTGGTQEQVAAAFLDSAEYSALFPANSTFVLALYGDILGRQPSSSEVSIWLSALIAGMTRAQVDAAFLGSTEAATRGADGLYGIILARATSSGEQSIAAAALQGGETLVGLAAGLFGSAEFALRAKATVG
jgi:streptogramin lyase